MRALAVLSLAAINAGCAGGSGPDVDREGDGPLMAFHVAHEEKGPGLERREFDGRRVYIEREPAVSDPDIVRADAELREGGVMVDLELRPDAAERMRRVTGENIGRALAILFNGGIIGVPVIQSEIGGRSQVLIPAGSAAEAQENLELVRARWPSE